MWNVGTLFQRTKYRTLFKCPYHTPCRLKPFFVCFKDCKITGVHLVVL